MYVHTYVRGGGGGGGGGRQDIPPLGRTAKRGHRVAMEEIPQLPPGLNALDKGSGKIGDRGPDVDHLFADLSTLPRKGRTQKVLAYSPEGRCRPGQIIAQHLTSHKPIPQPETHQQQPTTRSWVAPASRQSRGPKASGRLEVRQRTNDGTTTP